MRFARPTQQKFCSLGIKPIPPLAPIAIKLSLFVESKRCIFRIQLMMKLLVVVLLAILTAGLRAETGPVTLDLTKSYTKADYVFLSTAIGSSQVVALGESIHVTREMPRVRLQIVRYLQEQMGFNVIAFEGSLLNARTAGSHKA